jgi:hypothetical protein
MFILGMQLFPVRMLNRHKPGFQGYVTRRELEKLKFARKRRGR